MKQVIYNGDMGPNITAGGIPFTAGEVVTVNDDELADALLAKPNFSEATAKAVQASVYAAKVTQEPASGNP